jgi:hypothetical protein
VATPQGKYIYIYIYIDIYIYIVHLVGYFHSCITMHGFMKISITGPSKI